MPGRANRYGGAWPAFRLTILARDLWTCQWCGVLLTTGAAAANSAVVHHKVAAEEAPERMFDPSNVEALCKACHDGAAQSAEREAAEIKRRGLTIGPDGWPVRQAPAVLRCGKR